MDSSARSSIRDGATAAVPFGVTSLVFGVSFGVLAVSSGIEPLVAIVMSATVWAGSAQFAIAAVLGAGGTAAAAIGAAVLLNARYGAMSLALAPSLSGGPLRRAAESLALVDESWAMATVEPGRFDLGRLLGAALVMYPAWLLGTAIGVAAGDVIGDPAALGLDAAFPAFFLALLVPQLRDRPAIAAALLAAVIALLLVPFVPPGLPIIASAVAALIGLRRSGEPR